MRGLFHKLAGGKASRERDHTHELLNGARSLFKHGDGLGALRIVEGLLETHSGAAGLHHFKGLCLNRLGRHDEALREFEAELEINPNDPDANRWRERLSKALARREVGRIPWQQRSWNTSLPREALLDIQNSLHNYSYRGVPMLKNPFDVALYPLLLWRLKPRTIFEIGSKSGGSGLWFGDLLNSFGIDGHVYSIDIVRVTAVSHPRTTFMEGDGRHLEQTLPENFLRDLPRPWLVIEDADHEYATSIAVLKFFHPNLRAGEYIVVEDGIISDLSEDAECNSGPHRALKEFLHTHPNDYAIDDEYCDFFGTNVTWATNGFLKRLSDVAPSA